MKNVLFISFVLLGNLFCPVAADAQTGWKWGIACKNTTMLDAWPMAIDKSGNVFLSGYNYKGDSVVFGTITVYNPAHNQQLIVTKADTAGNFIWAVGTQQSQVSPISLATDVNGNVYSLGWYDSSNVSIGSYTLTNPAKQYLYFIVKFSPTGTVLWAKNISEAFIFNFGGLNADIGTDGSGNIYMTGNFWHNSINIGTTTLANHDPTGLSPDIFIAKFDSLGNPIWAKNFGGDTTEQRSTIAVNKNGDFFVSGSYYSPAITIGSTTLTDSLFSITHARRCYYFIARFDANGNAIWAKRLNNHISINKMSVDESENIFITGGLDSTIILGLDTLAEAGAKNMFIARYDSSGNFIWANSAGANYYDEGISIANDRCGHIWLCGEMGNSMNFNGHILSESPGAYDPVFIAEYDTSGKYLNSIALPSGGDDAIGIVVDNKGNFYLGGDYWQAEMVIGPDTLFKNFSELLFIAKYKFDTAVCPESIVIIHDTVYNHIDTSICSSVGTINIYAPPNYNSYLWNDGSSNSSLSVSGSGTYWVKATDGNSNLVIDTFNVVYKPSPIVVLGNNTTLCKDGSIILGSPQPPGASYLWSNGSSDSAITVFDSGYYSLTVTINGCSAANTVHVNEISAPVVKLGSDTLLCFGDNLPLQVNNNLATYIWSDGSNGQSFTVSEPGTYWVNASNKCGTASDTINVTYEFCDIWFPSAFTPNGDGRNDIIRAVGNLDMFRDFSLSIFNRYGQRVFFTQDIYSGWDGTYNGSNQDLGTYFYMIHLSLKGKKHMMKGNFELIR